MVSLFFEWITQKFTIIKKYNTIIFHIRNETINVCVLKLYYTYLKKQTNAAIDHVQG